MLTEKDYKNKEIGSQTEIDKTEEGLETYYYPNLGLSVRAKNAEEANKKLEETLNTKNK